MIPDRESLIETLRTHQADKLASAFDTVHTQVEARRREVRALRKKIMAARTLYECWLRLRYALSRDTPQGRARKTRIERIVCAMTPS